MSHVIWKVAKINFNFCPQYPENVTTGIKVAIENSLPYSTVYVFTDASAKDSEMYEEVKCMTQKKQIQLI